MTFKDIRIWSRCMTYDELASCNSRCIKNGKYKQAFAYNSMMWLYTYNNGNPCNKIIYWKYALRAYNFHKKHPDESLKIKTKHLP